MSTQHLDTDYLILGAGAMGMAFADVILAEDPVARIIMVDRHANPGGHWNDAYPFVRLHQPAAFYGLNSTHLGQGGEDLSSVADIVAYYRDAMDRFLHTGRVRFLPMSEHKGDGRIVSTLDRDRVTTVTANRRIVDGTYMQVKVPSICPPRYTIDSDATVIPPNGLAQIRRPHERYVIIGAGKTGIDSLLFLLDNGVSPDRIQWIVSNDSWLLDRGMMQPGLVLDTVVSMVRSIADATNIDDAFLQLERKGIVFRLDTQSLPTKWRCATVDRRELAELRRIDNVIRLGRVQHVGGSGIRLDRGTIGVVEDTLFVDCSANGLAKVDARPLFSAGHVTLQSVFMCQQTFSAALIAHLELLSLSDERRNRICAAVPHPELKQDLPTALVTTAQNMLNCNRHMPLWLRRSRLYLGHHAAPHRYLLGSGKLALLQRRAVTSMDNMRQQASIA
ncbi:NAD(P)/FAD-dependent oxidoreductase [Mycobacterium sp.]|uniref:NAD(P)/FAD-dependent oxidoreductase n=1 Tax=Mycobacterium sp. TaxID=1785 RepID=UPI0031CFA095